MKVLRISLYIVLALVITTVSTYLLFPWDLLERSAMNLVNDRLPPKMTISNFDLKTFTSFQITPVVTLKTMKVALPLDITASVGWNKRTIQFKHASTDRLSGSINGNSRSASIKVDKFRLQKLIPDMKGQVTGSLNTSLDENNDASGTFTLKGQTGSLKGVPIVPPFLRSQTINSFKTNGTINKKTIQFKSLKMTTNQTVFEGSGRLNVKFPIPRSTIRFNLQMTVPVSKSFSISMSLKEIGF